jgi:hypothetical protein
MALLKQPESNSFEIDALALAGVHIATCLEIADQFGVERPKFENPQEKEVLDVTRFLFGFRGQDGRTYKVQSYEFRISGSPKSNLFKFLTAWLGHPPKYGWDYCDLKGAGAMITVAHKPSRDGTRTFAVLNGIAPVIDQLRSQVLPVSAFAAQPLPAAMPAPVPAQTRAQIVPFPAPAASRAPQPASAPQVPQPPQQAWDPSVDPQSNCPF